MNIADVVRGLFELARELGSASKDHHEKRERAALEEGAVVCARLGLNLEALFKLDVERPPLDAKEGFGG